MSVEKKRILLYSSSMHLASSTVQSVTSRQLSSAPDRQRIEWPLITCTHRRKRELLLLSSFVVRLLILDISGTQPLITRSN